MTRLGLAAALALAAMVAAADAQILPGSSTSTTVAPPANNAGRAGRMVLLPEGRQGLTFGGTPYSQMVGTTGGDAAIMVPSSGGPTAIVAPGGSGR